MNVVLGNTILESVKNNNIANNYGTSLVDFIGNGKLRKKISFITLYIKINVIYYYIILSVSPIGLTNN